MTSPKMLSAEELLELGRELQAMAADLVRRLGAEPSARSGDLSVPAALIVDTGSPASASADRRWLWIELGKLRAALDAMRAGRYGVCRRCAGPIGVQRLRARPTADVCVGCLTEPAG